MHSYTRSISFPVRQSAVRRYVSLFVVAIAYLCAAALVSYGWSTRKDRAGDGPASGVVSVLFIPVSIAASLLLVLPWLLSRF